MITLETRVMMVILTTTYGESVISMPYLAMSLSGFPIENGITYMVRPCMHPAKILWNSAFISSGDFQWLVKPASSSFSEQMKVRSSTRATSLLSDRARKECCGLFNLMKVPVLTIRSQRPSYSAWLPSQMTTSVGVHRSIQP